MAVGVSSPRAAAFLLEHIQTLLREPGKPRTISSTTSRHGAKIVTAQLFGVVSAGDRSPAQRLALLQAIQQGEEERGEPLDERGQEAGWRAVPALLADKSAERGWAWHSGRGRSSTWGVDSRPQECRQADRSVRLERGEAMRAIAAIDVAKGLALMRTVLTDSAAPIEVREIAAISLANLERPEAQSAVLEAFRRPRSGSSRRWPRPWPGGAREPSRC